MITPPMMIYYLALTVIIAAIIMIFIKQSSEEITSLLVIACLYVFVYLLATTIISSNLPDNSVLSCEHNLTDINECIDWSCARESSNYVETILDKQHCGGYPVDTGNWQAICNEYDKKEYKKSKKNITVKHLSIPNTNRTIIVKYDSNIYDKIEIR